MPTYLREIVWMNQGYTGSIRWSEFSCDWLATIA